MVWVVLLWSPFGYYFYTAKIQLVAKEEFLASAQHIFDDSGVQNTSAGQSNLVAALVSPHFIRDYT